MEALLEGQWEGLSKTAVALALRGDTTALRLCFDRIAPVRRGTSIEIPGFPKVEKASDVPVAMAALVAAVTGGIITADEAAPISTLLTAYVGALDATTFAERLAELEKAVEETRRRGTR